MLAAKAASALVCWNTSAKCSIVPAPPLAMIGTSTASAMALVISRSKPALVPSLSKEVKRISPAPNATAFFAQSMASISITTFPPWVKMK